MTVQGSGSSDTNRIYIMPGYAAQQMAVPGNHDGHTGQVIFALGGLSGDPYFGIGLSSRSYITIDGYSDPRPSGGNNPKFTIRDVNHDWAALIGVVDHVGLQCEMLNYTKK